MFSSRFLGLLGTGCLVAAVVVQGLKLKATMRLALQLTEAFGLHIIEDHPGRLPA